jgi:NAD(P)H dehydrogenase (quinone)
MATTSTKNILLIQGNPDTHSFTAALAATYEEAARAAGHTVSCVNVSELTFDPILHKGYKEIQPLEPDLLTLQEKWKVADHVVIVYPNWWCAMPALLKGMFDRMFLPGFAFHFDAVTKRNTPLLKGKTARVIVVLGSQSPFMTWLKFGDYTNEIQHAILDFAGMKACITTFGPADSVSEKKRAQWHSAVRKLGARGR